MVQPFPSSPSPSGHAGRAFWDMSLDLLALADRGGNLLEVNDRWQQLLGYAPQDMVSRPYVDFVHVDDRSRVADDLHALLVGEVQEVAFGCRVRAAAGDYRHLDWLLRAYDDGAGFSCIARDITDLKRAQTEVDRAARYSRSLIEASLDPLVTISADGTIMDVNAATENATGVPRETLIGSDFSGYFTEPDQARAGYQLVFSQGHVTDYPLAIRHASGAITDVLYNATVYSDEHGQIAGVFAAARDITDLKRAQTELAVEAQLRIAMDNSAIGMGLVSPENRFLRVNAKLCEILGRTADELQDLTWLDVTHPEDVQIGRDLVADLAAGRRRSFRVQKRYLSPDGRVVWGDASVAAVLTDEGAVRHHIVQIIDITDRVTAEHELITLATHDPLTGLANRAALSDEIGRALRAGRRSGRLTAVLMIDLDRFKNVNDSLGHAVGDELLQAAARRIESCIRSSDLLARPGGDEFVVVMRDVADATSAVRTAWRIVTALRMPFRTTTAELSATASIGVALSADGSVADDLVRDADTAMYLAKSQGRDRVTVFNDDLRVAATFRLATEAQLRHALERDELAVWYQPEVDLTTGSLIAVEALLRWHHPSGELYTAARFIDIAEETGLILDIGDWVTRTVCLQAASWAAARPAGPITVRLNLSTLQIADDGLLDAIDVALAASGVDPHCLCVEITETALLRETATAHANLVGIRERGIKVAVDDFGTGFASLAYLREYPVDVLKIDRSFVANITTSDQSRRLVAGILALSDALDITVTAEGVETPHQAVALRELGCRGAQGYLFSRAVPADQVPALLHTRFPLS